MWIESTGSGMKLHFSLLVCLFVCLFFYESIHCLVQLLVVVSHIDEV